MEEEYYDPLDRILDALPLHQRNKYLKAPVKAPIKVKDRSHEWLQIAGMVLKGLWWFTLVAVGTIGIVLWAIGELMIRASREVTGIKWK